MTRAVVVGTNAYPYLIRFWYELFLRYFQDEVDKVYFAVSQPEHFSPFGYTKTMLSQHPKIEIVHTGVNWPESLNRVARIAIEKYDTVWFPHDDTLVFKKGVVDNYFKMSEEEHAIVTTIHPIFRPKDTVEELMKRKWPNQVPFVEPVQNRAEYSFYCNNFFAPSDLMRKTRVDFGEWHVPVGQYCPELDWTPLTKEFGSDTNFELCLDLLEQDVNWRPIPTYEPTNFIHAPNPIKAIQDFDWGDAGWLHLQTMAYHIYGLYWDAGVRERLEEQTGGDVKRLIENHETEKKNRFFVWDITFKIALIYEFMEVADYTGMQKYVDHTRDELEFIMDYLNIKHRDVATIKDIYHSLFFERNK